MTRVREHETFPTTRRWPGYVVAVAGTAVAVLVRWAVLRAVGDLPLYLTFYPVVVASAVVGGTGPGVLATLLSILAAALFFIEPFGKLIPATTADAVSIGLFIAINLVISILGGRLRLKSEALRQSQARLLLAHETARIGAFEWNVKTGVNLWTQAMETMYGLKPGEFDRTESAWEQLVHPEDRAKAIAAVERALKTFQPQESEWRVVWPDGSVHWFIGRFQAFKDHAGKPLRLVGANVDITLRKQAEQAVWKSEERFRALVAASSDVVYRMSPDWSEMRQLHGRHFLADAETPIRSWLEKYIYPEDQPHVLAAINKAIETKTFFELEHRVWRVDGTLGWTFSRAIPLLDDKGEIREWFGAAGDVTRRKQAEQALTRQARLIDLAPAATLVRRLDGTISFWSRGAERLYGWPKEEALGCHTNDLLRTEFPEPLESIAAKLRGGGTWSGELRHYTRDGRQVVVESYWLAELNANGQVEEFLESNTDITDRKRLQEHLEEAVEERTAKLREAIAELEHMSYSMVHDMRAPLRAMQSFASLLQEECAECRQPPALDYLSRIGESANRLDRLVTDALNYNQVVRDDLPVTPVELGCLLRGIIQTYPNLQSPMAQITIEFDQLFVLGNMSLLTQCFGNLLGNAVKFVAPGTRPRVRVWAQEIPANSSPANTCPAAPTGPTTPSPASVVAAADSVNHTPQSSMVRVCIADNGIGIPKYAQEKIFLIFQRMHRESEYPGTGIGLPIVKKVVERMNGRVGVESEPDRGSQFWVELPKPPDARTVVHDAA